MVLVEGALEAAHAVLDAREVGVPREHEEGCVRAVGEGVEGGGYGDVYGCVGADDAWVGVASVATTELETVVGDILSCGRCEEEGKL